MIKIGISILFSLFCFRAYAIIDKMVDFRNGNQIVGSTLTIFTDGSVQHSERTCCPPRTVPVPEQHLNSVQLNHINKLLFSASNTQTSQRRGEPTTEGSKSGSLVGFYGGNRLIIYQIERSRSPGGFDSITYNTSTAATELEKIVNEYVQNPLYH